ncbi:hypothetical protein D1007_61641 [Hordeum vulgare]|nr:hypothetical protein D1007_61641 [Hordeum vulgare]
MSTVADGVVAAMTASSRFLAVVAERAIAPTFDGVVAATAPDGGVAAMAACNSCRRAAAAERVVGIARTPNTDTTRTTLHHRLRCCRGVASQLELSSDDGEVVERRRWTDAIGDCGKGRPDKIQG